MIIQAPHLENVEHLAQRMHQGPVPEPIISCSVIWNISYFFLPEVLEVETREKKKNDNRKMDIFDNTQG